MNPDINNFLSEFNKMVDTLKKNVNIRLFSFHVFPPVSDIEINEVESSLGKKLPDDIIAFYKQCNGIQLRWGNLKNPAWDKEELTGFTEGPFSWQDILDDNGFIDGCVNILPLKEVFLTEWSKLLPPFEWQSKFIAVDGITIAHEEYYKRYYVFDRISEYTEVRVSVDHTFSNCVRSNRNAFTLSHRIPLIIYLQSILCSCGARSGRKFFVDEDRITDDFIPPVIPQEQAALMIPKININKPLFTK